MASNNQTRLLNGGIESDRPPFGAEPSEVLHSLNMHPVIQGKGGKTSLQSFPGNIAMMFSDVLPPGPTNPPITYTLLGKCVYEPDNVAYLFFHASSGPHRIIRFDGNAPTVFFRSDYVVGGTGWTVNTFISCAATKDLLIFTDGTTDVRYLNRATTYSSVTPITQAQLSIIPEPGVVPLLVGRNNNALLGRQIQTVPVQFSYIFTNTDNIRSVLAPFSLTALPARESQMATLSYFWNVITVIMLYEQKIPENWKTVEFVVRYPETNKFDIIRRWSRGNPADEAAVNTHNSGSGGQLTLTNWDGSSLETLDPVYAAKQAEALARTADVLTLSLNRLFLGNVLNGYNTPVIKPVASLTLNNFNTVLPGGTTYPVFILQYAHEPEPGLNKYDGYFTMLVRISGKNYVLPEDINPAFILRYNATPDTYPVFWTVPDNINMAFLRELTVTADLDLTNVAPATITIQRNRWLAINEAHGTTIDFEGGGVALGLGPNSRSYGSFQLQADPDEYGLLGKNRLFAPGDSYDVGIRYYDAGMRSSGLLFLSTINIPAYSPDTLVMTESISATLSNAGNPIPAWAEYYGLTLTSNKKANRLIEFVPDTIKVAIKDSVTGEIKLGGNVYLTTPPSGFELYGLAISTSSLPRYGYGYSYTAGDSIELSGFNNAGSGPTLISGPVLGASGGYVYMKVSSGVFAQLDNIVPDGSNTYVTVGGGTGIVLTPSGGKTQNIVFATILMGQPGSDEQFEVAKFGPVVGPAGSRIFGNFYSSGTTTAVLLGDYYTQKRIGSTGSATGFAGSPYEINNAFHVTDLGRVAPVDNVGEQQLGNTIIWSNPNIPGSNTNGYGTFDAQDYAIVDSQAGEIRALVPTTKGIQDGGQMVVLCTHGSFVCLVGQQQIKGGDTNNAFTAVVGVLGNLNPIAGGRGMQTYRAFDSYQGSVWWVDVFRKEVVEFNSAGAGSVSRFGNAELFKALLTSGEPRVGVNPYSTKVLVSMPQRSGEKPTLPTTNLPDPLFAEYRAPASYAYNWEENRWSVVYLSGAEFLRIGNDVYGWKSRDLWKEFQSGNSFYGESDSNICFVTVPFNQAYPKVIQPQAIAVTSNRPPDFCWIICQNLSVQQIAMTRPWSQSREGVWRAAIMRDRLSNNAVSPTEWDASNFNGASLKGDVPIVVLGWNRSNGMVEIQTATLEFTLSSGQ